MTCSKPFPLWLLKNQLNRQEVMFAFSLKIYDICLMILKFTVRPANRTFLQRSTTTSRPASQKPAKVARPAIRINEDDEISLNGKAVKLPPVPSTSRLFEIVPDRVPRKHGQNKKTEANAEQQRSLLEIDERWSVPINSHHLVSLFTHVMLK